MTMFQTNERSRRDFKMTAFEFLFPYHNWQCRKLDPNEPENADLPSLL